MIGDVQADMQACQKAGAAIIQQMGLQSLKQLVSFANPPPPVFLILQTVQTVLAGSLTNIEVNPATNQPKTDDWSACRKMIIKEPTYFIKACMQFFGKLKNDRFSDIRVQKASQKLQQSGTSLQKAQMISIACGQLLSWLQVVIKYWKLLKAKPL